MALIRARVEAPDPVAPLYGLLDVAQTRANPPRHWQTGVEYDSVACHDAKVWGQWCTGVGTPFPAPVTRTVMVTFTGTRTGTDPDYEYGVTVAATVDGGPTRQIQLRVEVQNVSWSEVINTGAAATSLFTGTAPVQAEVTVIDVATGTAMRTPIVQVVDGTLTAPDAPLIMAVPEQGVPDGCDAITTTFTAAAATTGGGATVTAIAATMSPDPRDLVVYVGSHRATIRSGDSETTVADNLAPGLYRVTVRDMWASSFVSGWIYIDDVNTGMVMLVSSTCPVKDVTSPPWTTVTADPVTIYAEVICKSIAFSDAEAAARDALEAGAAKAIERYYWDTLIMRGQALAAGNAVSPARAVAELEQYIAGVYHGRGVIHTSPWGVAFLSAAGVLDDTAVADERLRTWRGTPVVVGSGYSREGTHDPATGADFWMFVTGSIAVLHDAIVSRESVDKQRNDLFAIAEQTVAVLDDCPVPGVVHVSPEVAA